MASVTCMCSSKKEARVHVIYTGGSIGMLRNDAGVLMTIKNELFNRLREYPYCHDKTYEQSNENGDQWLVLPSVEGELRVLYDIDEYTSITDSCCMNTKDWQRIANDVGDAYHRYDGFVILHGTDTMAYTASALAFLLENLGKPVVVTGAQLPIFDIRTDGRDNFIGSLLLAGNYNIPEVLIVFGGRVLRGCRSTKANPDSFHAFESPNHPFLGTIAANIEINGRKIFRSCNLGTFSLHTELETNVGLLRIYPGINAAVVRAFLSEPMKGVVIQSFGVGNLPSNDDELMDEICKAIKRGVLIVNISQCPKGSVSPINVAGTWMETGVISGCDMTQEAALTKLAYVLGKREWDFCNKKKMMEVSLRGEMTTNKVAKINDIDFIEGVARTLHLSMSNERHQMCSIFFPALVEAAVREDDVVKLKNLRQYGANLSDTNTEGRTALHLACFLGKLDSVKCLLAEGCPVDLTDRFNRTPLHEAIDSDNHEIIQLLLKKGAVLPEESVELAEQLRALTEHDRIERLESYRLAGANLDVVDGTGRSALHHACQLGKTDVVRYLLPFYENPSIKDSLGLGPIQYAKVGNHCDIVAMLCASKQN
ncbi:uncharacterized protein LOC115772079 [Drosophila novamexicana]|uniref:uncharacterized protein LOC115772079 n=1 Tax=Drosophila novamexicana TaxID=47314 RepID=UPI0011E58C7C|nr:uncharacterized protein LOC115772079 [Drosophila novamexicana]